MTTRTTFKHRYKNDRSTGLANISGRDMNAMMDRVEALTGLRGIGVVATGSHYALKRENDKTFLASITARERDSSSGVYYYSWKWAQKFPDNSTEIVEGAPLGDPDNLPLFELNDGYIPIGTVVEAHWTEDNFVWCAYGGGGVSAAGGCGPGCGWVAGLRTDQCVRLTLVEALGLCSNDAPYMDDLLCYETAVTAWTEDGCLSGDGGDGSGIEPDPWWCVDGACVQSATDPDPGNSDGPHLTYGDCATACSITGTFGEDCNYCGSTPATWTTTLSGFTGTCAVLNGSRTLTQEEGAACKWSETLSGGYIAYLLMISGSFAIFRLTSGTGEIYTQYNVSRSGSSCCDPLNLIVAASAACDSYPLSITLVPSC